MSLHPPVLFIGDRPTKRNAHPDVAFVGTRSYKTLLDWIRRMQLDISKVYIINAYDINGDPSRLYGLNRNWKKVALGHNATNRLVELAPYTEPLEWFNLPHPSGLNRQVNDKETLAIKLEECKNFIYTKEAGK
jgi:uracil-DNA glycosylase